MDYLKFYDLESYLFNDVKNNFHKNKFLDAFDFFCIIIWKANRAKSKHSSRMLNGKSNLDVVVRELTSEIYNATNDKVRLRTLMNDRWKFLLPTATAILAVLYPEEFTVYDIRVCGQLGAFSDLGNRTNFNSIWEGYEEFRQAVRNIEPKEHSLRDKDRYLWGKSFAEQLENDIKNNFIITENNLLFQAMKESERSGKVSLKNVKDKLAKMASGK